METRDQGVVRIPPGEGETLWVLGDFVAFKADGESASLSVFEGLIPPEGGPPPHIHYQQEALHQNLNSVLCLGATTDSAPKVEGRVRVHRNMPCFNR